MSTDRHWQWHGCYLPAPCAGPSFGW